MDVNKISALTTPIEFDSGDFFSVLSLSMGTAVARQNKFGELIVRKSSWKVNVGKRTIKFGKYKFGIGLIGTESEYSDTWLWGWAHNENGFPENFSEPSDNVKRLLPNCPEVNNAQFDLDELRMGHNLSMVTVGAADKNVCYYRCPYDGGAMFVQVEGLPEEVFEPLTLTDILHQQIDIISSCHCSHKLLAAGMLHQNGYKFTDNGNNITSEFNGQVLRIDFENCGDFVRTSNISLNHI